MNSFNTYLQIEDLEMEDRIYYDIDTEDYITESDLRKRYIDFVDDENNEYISFSEYINNCLVINGGNLETVGF